MTPIRMVDGLPHQGEQPVVLVAAHWPDNVPDIKARGLAREWAEQGLTGIVCPHELAADVARRAGLLAIVPTALSGDAPHLVEASPDHRVVATVDEAFAAALAGERFILGELDAVAALAAFLAVADADEPWQPAPAQGDWLLARAGGLGAAYGPAGGDVQVAVKPGQSIHWFHPLDGAPVAINTPEPDDLHTVRVAAGTPMALLMAPSRFVAADIDALS